MALKKEERRKLRERREREKEEEEEERRGWSRCTVCGEEYSKDVRVIPGCLHSFCYDCILHSSSTSSSCPICHTLITSPLPSLPVNYSLLTWLSLSPIPLSLNDNDDDNKSDSDNDGDSDDDNNGDKGEEEKEGNGRGVCEGCEEGPKELYCGDCDRHYCSVCSNLLHSIKVNRSHSLSPPISRSKPPHTSPIQCRSPLIASHHQLHRHHNGSGSGSDHHHGGKGKLNSSLPSPPSSPSSISSSLAIKERNMIRCEECGVHGGQEKRLYCVFCNEFVCSICIDDHSDHKIISVFKYIDLIKDQWKSNLKEEIDHILYQFQNESKIMGKLNELNDEITKLHGKLLTLEEKKEKYQKMIDDIHHLKLHFDLTNRYLLSFLLSLPPLPLSSFYSPPPSPSPPSDQITHNNNNEKLDHNIDYNRDNNDHNRDIPLHPHHHHNHLLPPPPPLPLPHPLHDPRSDLPLPSLDPPLDQVDNNNHNNNDETNINNDNDKMDNNNNIINKVERGEEEREEKKRKMKEGRKRIKEFFERDNIQKIYSSFLPITDSNFFSSSPSFISKEEIEGRNQRIMENQLMFDENLVLSFGCKGNGPAAPALAVGLAGGMGGGMGIGVQFSSPYFIALNLSKGSSSIAVSDYAKKRVGVFDSKGIFKYQLQLNPPAPNQQTNPWGVAIISKHNLLAVVDHSNHQIQLVDLESGEMRSKIGKGMGKEIGQFTNPRGIAYCSDLDLIAVCDQNNHRVQMFRLSTGEYHSSIPLTFQPWDVDISLHANLIVISDCCNHKVHLYSFLPLHSPSSPHPNQSPLHPHPSNNSNNNNMNNNNNNNNGKSLCMEIRYKKIKEIGSGRERPENGQFSSPRGVGIHGKAKYFVVADEGNVRLQFFTLTGDFIASYNPLLLNGTPYFHRPFGIAIDKKEHVIAVSDPSLAKILLFKSPIF